MTAVYKYTSGCTYERRARAI